MLVSLSNSAVEISCAQCTKYVATSTCFVAVGGGAPSAYGGGWSAPGYPAPAQPYGGGYDYSAYYAQQGSYAGYAQQPQAAYSAPAAYQDPYAQAYAQNTGRLLEDFIHCMQFIWQVDYTDFT